MTLIDDSRPDRTERTVPSAPLDAAVTAREFRAALAQRQGVLRRHHQQLVAQTREQVSSTMELLVVMERMRTRVLSPVDTQDAMQQVEPLEGGRGEQRRAR